MSSDNQLHADQHAQACASSENEGLYRHEFEHDACGIGALAHLKGQRSHQMIDDALSVLVNLEHRGGKGLEHNTGDGAGILFQVPHRFFRREAQRYGYLLPDEGDYGVAMLFFPQDEEGLAVAKRVFEDGCAEQGIPLLFWRSVPTDAHDLGETAKACMPTIVQAFLGRPENVERGQAFERALYVCRRVIEKKADAESALSGKIFYVCSMSSRTIVYKGMLVATQMRRFYPDLADASTESSIALVHSRYSTNTTPSWERAHPNRYIIHNGEINTLKGNVNWIRAREPGLYSPVMGADLKKVIPIINREGSDSAILDNVLEFLTMNGRSLPRAVSMLLPEPWDKNPSLSEKRRAYDSYQSMLMESWDGPAAIAFTDGIVTGAALDRNGLRPARYYVTRDDRLILTSEVGALRCDPEEVLQTGSLGPGQMLLVDPAKGRVLWDDEIKEAFANQKPYRDWAAAETIDVEGLKPADSDPFEQHDAKVPLVTRLARHGYHFDDVEEAILPMAQKGAAPLASMGADIPLAVLSRHPRSFFDYFNQLFAQVTNPPIDALRESFVTSTLLYLGNHGNMLEDMRDNCRLVRLQGPILTKDEFDRICAIDHEGFEARRFFATYKRDGGDDALEKALDELGDEIVAAVREGVNIIVLSDRAADGEVSIPSLLAVGSVHNRLLAAGIRTRADLVVECGDAITPHDFATLVGYSASGIYPYMAHDCIRALSEKGELALSAEEGIANYNKAITKGIVSVMSKMGERKGDFLEMNPVGTDRTKLEFLVPSRGLFGYRNEFLTDTKGEGIMASVFDSYQPVKGDVVRRHTGSLISYETGVSITYGLFNAQERGVLFIGAGVPVYEGMIIGSTPRSEDITVNVCKAKHLTNTRASGSDDALRLVPPKQMSLEQCLEYLGDDELLEVTPKSLRMRKSILSNEQRMKSIHGKKNK
ncbi:MAG: glutamate synthase central domain-containing protein [Atopobiaceae bacterium]|nr:glutamate synthase central domain-containing protein [Atopobiaceae bacterium]